MAEIDVTSFEDEDEQPETRGRKARTSREAEKRPVSWRPAALLPDPNPEEGYVFRWVRVGIMGQDDATNVSAKLREGYEPVKASEHPEMELLGTPFGRFKDTIIVGGLMLCKIPQELAGQRDAYYRTAAQAQMTSVEQNFMRQSDARMPLFAERKSKSSFGSGN